MFYTVVMNPAAAVIIHECTRKLLIFFLVFGVTAAIIALG